MSDDTVTIHKLQEAIEEWDVHKAKKYAEEAMESGISPDDAINKGLAIGMDHLSVRFDKGEVFLPQIMSASKAMDAALEIIEPYMAAGGVKLKGVVVMGSVKGDIHEIGKTVCCAMLRGAGYKVIDLGCDVSADQFAEAAVMYGADIIGGSALMTTSLFQQKDIVRVFKEDKLSVMTIFGGAPCSKEWVDEIGGDGYSSSGSEIVELVKSLIS